MFEAKVREVFEVESKKRVAGFRDGSLRRYQTTTNDSMAFVLKILCFERLKHTRTSTLMKLAVSIHWTGVDRAMVIGTKISRSKRVESANAADRRSIHRNKSP